MCSRTAYDDPAVKQLMVEGNGNAAMIGDNQYKLAQARKIATTKCLQDRGIVRRGGVEPPAAQ